MGRSELLQGIREMKFVSVYKRFRGGELSQMDAAELLGISDRTFRRWAERFGDEGAAGLTDRRRGNAAHNRAPQAEADSVEVLYRTRYAGFTAKHFHEHLVNHGFRWGYTLGSSPRAGFGPNLCCSGAACCRGRRDVARTAAAVLGGRCRG